MPSFSLSAAAVTPVYLQWLRVDSNHPQTLFVGGRFSCPQYVTDFMSDQACPPFVMRSIDGGLHWVGLRRAIGHVVNQDDPLLSISPLDYLLSPPVIGADGQHIYIDVVVNGGASFNAAYVLRSHDAGLHWQRLPIHRYVEQSGACGGNGLQDVTPSPVQPGRLYAESVGDTCASVASSDDDGSTFRDVANPSTLIYCPGGCGSWGGLVADPVRPNTVYANITNYLPLTQTVPAYVARSDDAGLHWSVVMTPTASPPLQTFTVTSDPHEGTLLVGRTQDTGVPADRRYLSADAGRSWRIATCPGDWQGVCPAVTVDHVFGAGASYGFVANGVYRFHGGGPAVARQHLGAPLPFTTAALLDVGAGHHAGDPLYALARGVRGPEHGLLYRSSDGGHTWQRLLAGPFPLHCAACVAGGQ